MVLTSEGSVLVTKSVILPTAYLSTCPVILETACASQVVVTFFFSESMWTPLKETKQQTIHHN